MLVEWAQMVTLMMLTPRVLQMLKNPRYFWQAIKCKGTWAKNDGYHYLFAETAGIS